MKLNSAKRRFPKGKRFFTVGGRRSAFGVRRSAVGGRRSAVGGWRSVVGGRRWRLAFGGRRSAVGVRRSAVGGRLRRRKRKTQGIKYHHKFALWCDMICKAAGKGHKNAAKRRGTARAGGGLLSQTRTRPTAALPPECVRAPRRGIEIITSPGA